MAALNIRLKSFIGQMHSAPEAIIASTQKSLMLQREFMESLNRAQLEEGLYTDGTLIQLGYSKSWEFTRRVMNLQVEYVDLKFTGTFHESIHATPSFNFIEFSSSDKKAGELVDRFNRDNILGLTEENARNVQLAILPSLANMVADYLRV